MTTETTPPTRVEWQDAYEEDGFTYTDTYSVERWENGVIALGVDRDTEGYDGTAFEGKHALRFQSAIDAVSGGAYRQQIEREATQYILDQLRNVEHLDSVTFKTATDIVQGTLDGINELRRRATLHPYRAQQPQDGGENE
jgi:hypothetical protein